MPIFLDDEDKTVFVSLFKRYLSPKAERKPDRHYYPTYHGDVEILTFALMSNHFHLLVYQVNERSITSFMRSLMISYGRYFNKKYQRQGPVFQSRYLAKIIEDTDYLTHMSRYIHLNPENWQRTTDNSLDFYSRKRHANWINPKKILQMFPSYEAYLEFLKTYDPKQDEVFADIEPDD